MKLEDLAKEYLNNCIYENGTYVSDSEVVDAYKAGFRKAKEMTCVYEISPEGVLQIEESE